MLPSTRGLDRYIQTSQAILWLNTECTTLLLQHGARINYSNVFLKESPVYLGHTWSNRKEHSKEFVELLRAADTDFDGVREQIVHLDRTEWQVLNLDVVEEKLSQPLTLQTLCVISVRRRLHSISDAWMWASIDALPLPNIIKDRLKLIVR